MFGQMTRTTWRWQALVLECARLHPVCRSCAEACAHPASQDDDLRSELFPYPRSPTVQSLVKKLTTLRISAVASLSCVVPLDVRRRISIASLLCLLFPLDVFFMIGVANFAEHPCHKPSGVSVDSLPRTRTRHGLLMPIQSMPSSCKQALRLTRVHPSQRCRSRPLCQTWAFGWFVF